MKFRALALTTVLALTAGSFSLGWGSKTFDTAEQEQIQQIIHQYLISNPNILVEVAKALQEKQAAEAKKAVHDAIVNNKQELFFDKQSPALGSDTPETRIVEFFDYQCGHCKKVGPIISQLLSKQNSIRVIFKELPIFGEESEMAAKAALASTEQGKYYAFHNALLASKQALTEKIIFDIAKQVKLDVPKLKKSMQSAWIQKQIEANFSLAKQLRLNGTPVFVFGAKDLSDSQLYPGSMNLAQMEKTIAGMQGTVTAKDDSASSDKTA